MCSSRMILAVAVAGVMATCPLLHGEKEERSAEGFEDYEKVKALLAAKCYSCHGVLKQKARLRLDTRDLMLKGEVIVPGEAADSLLIALVEDGSEARMPPMIT